MIWIIFPIVAAFGYTISNFINNYIIDTALKRKSPEALQVGYILVPILVITFLLAFFGFDVFSFRNPNSLILFAAGFIGVFGALPYFNALRLEETFSVTIFAQSSPLIALMLGTTILGEQITGNQSLAFILIFAAIFIIIATTKRPRHSNKINIKSALFVFVACLIWTSANVIFMLGVDANTPELLGNSIAWRALGSLVGLASMMLFKRQWVRTLKNAIKGRNVKYAVFLFISNCTDAFSEIFARIGIVLAPAISIMSVTSNISQLFFTFVLGIFLSILWPKFGREKLTKRVLLSHLVAVVLAISGVILLNT